MLCYNPANETGALDLEGQRETWRSAINLWFSQPSLPHEASAFPGNAAGVRQKLCSEWGWEVRRGRSVESTRDEMREKLPAVFCCTVEDKTWGFDFQMQKER